MWKRVGVVVIWVLAAVGTTSITLAAVSQVGGRVTEQAAGPIDSSELAAARAATVAATPAATRIDTAPQTGDSPTTTSVATSTADSTTSSTTPPVDIGSATLASEAETTTTVASGVPATPSTTTAAPPTTTEPPPTTMASERVTTTLIGGTITVQHSGSSVTLVSAVPNSGFWAEVKGAGPDGVSVEFESSNHESIYQASVDNGKLDVQTEEHQEDGD